MLRKAKTKLEKENQAKDKAAMAMYLQNERNIQASRVVDVFPILQREDLLALTTERINEIADELEDLNRELIKNQIKIKGQNKIVIKGE